MASLLLLLAASLSTFPSMASATDATISWMEDVPEWQQVALMRLQLTAPSGDAVPISYSVFPLTTSLGLNGTATTRHAVSISGKLVAVDPTDSNHNSTSDMIHYLSCDLENSSQIINEIMDNNSEPKVNPRAILLYSEKGNCCNLQGSNITFGSIFTMGNTAEAAETLNFTKSAEGVVRATIAGNFTNTQPGDQDSQNGSNSAVAMSILYSITGLITLLFLVIIATGAIRAHRYPERYGPRSGYGGRPRQSRAKGLARAVLETLPIVKFGDPTTPAKPDPALELEQQPSRSSPEPGARRLSAIPEEPQTPKNRQRDTAPKPDAEAIPEEAPTVQGAPAGAILPSEIGSGATHGPNDEHLGCSICTEDFTVGEDVRVLPCDHKFHPPCIDPWLINISGTCPLCRLDLRPAGEKVGTDNAEDPLQQPPPLSAYDAEEAGAPSRERRRSSRILDLHRLRQATVEERIEILRRHRSQQQASTTSQSSEGDSEERGRRARLADRLRDTFRIRTRTQSPGQAARGTTPPGATSS
ncbi:hypothetical protein B0H67DRAFT_366801 [Lasiosphaeris hirsuta]|uniref:RING-type domain-containing protein n=1 Tax=Lasiosphaeris hirsuta TaxID=260670 RepID=A0AA40DJ11_9PEZI|nr:hypothetical protein B0H67DRAFT_366801 [Lasiosphaeris hirsuta]